ncbi:MAG: hypothetical protein GQ523_02150 [Methanophagales archaeon]|nr:hypothetical protein [Methanophagales archaeon]
MNTHCKHESCGVTENIWLPYKYEGRSRGLKSHPYCIYCGVVKNISPDRAKPMGYYTNRLARMSTTKVQLRLIVKELESICFDDTYALTRSNQEKVFNHVVQKYC